VARLYANENFAFPVIEELRRRGHDAVTVAETGKANQKMSDDQVLEFAISDERAVLTFNRKHFFRLHRQRPDHQGIVACRRRTAFCLPLRALGGYAARGACGRADQDDPERAGQRAKAYRPEGSRRAETAGLLGVGGRASRSASSTRSRR
jgi:hypothetical protein